MKWPKNEGYFSSIFHATTQVKQSPDGRQFAQSGHPVQLCILICAPSMYVVLRFLLPEDLAFAAGQKVRAVVARGRRRGVRLRDIVRAQEPGIDFTKLHFGRKVFGQN
jgi:hypothetical protein